MDRVAQASLAITRTLLAEGADFLTKSAFMRMPGIHAAAGLTREALWARIRESALWRNVGARLKSSENFMPLLRTKRPQGAFYATPEDLDKPAEELLRVLRRREGDPVISLQESYDVSRLRSFLADCPARKANVDILVSVLSACASARPRARGRPSSSGAVPSPEADLLTKRMESLQMRERLAEDLLSHVEAESRPQPGSTVGAQQKRRRFQRASDSVVAHVVTYPAKHAFRSRLYAAESPSAQGMDQRLQAVMLPETVDLDSVNCLPTLMHRMVQRLELVRGAEW